MIRCKPTRRYFLEATSNPIVIPNDIAKAFATSFRAAHQLPTFLFDYKFHRRVENDPLFPTLSNPATNSLPNHLLKNRTSLSHGENTQPDGK